MSSTKDLGLSIAVVICTHNRPAILERCLQRLQQITAPQFSIVVVDSAPNSCEAKSLVLRYDARYCISALKGLSRARNIGTRAIDADIIAYLDDDMVPHATWLTSLLKEFTKPDVAVATGPILPLELCEATKVDLQLAVELKPWGPHRFQIDQSSSHWFERTNFGGAGDGNFALRRSLFEQIRGFDERLGRGAAIDLGEEHYAFFRCVELGLKTAYSPQAVVFHPNLSMKHDRLRKQIADTIAYAAFLAWNHPTKSWRVTRFLLEGTLRVRRWWHTSWKSEMASVSAKERIASGMNGLLIFLRSLAANPPN